MKRFALVAAATLTVSGMGIGLSVAAQPEQDQTHQQHQQPGQTGQPMMGGQVRATEQLPQGTKQVEVKHAGQIHEALAKTTDRAVARGEFNELYDMFTKADRERLTELEDQQLGTLNGRIAQIHNAWRQKYGDRLSVKADVFGEQFTNFEIVQGEITQPALLGNWPVMPTEQDQMQQPHQGEQPQRMGQMPGQQGHQMGPQPGQAAAEHLKEGSEIAVVSFPQQQDLPRLNVSLVREGGNWHIDIPDNVSAQRIHDQLLTHLTYFGEHVNQWPANEQEASRLLAHHVLMAVNDVSVPPGMLQQMQPQQQGQQTR